MKTELNDRILLVYSSNQNGWRVYHESLIKKGYEITLVDDFDISTLPQIPTDLVVLCLGEDYKTSDGLAEVQKRFVTASTPCILVTPTLDQDLEFNSLVSVKRMTYQDEVSKFLVMVKIQLRLRKLQTDQVESQVEVVSENASLRDLHNRFQKDLSEAREIHEKLLPNSLPDFSKLRCTSAYLPLEVVGGDLFDIWELESGRAGVFLGDITGHGLPAAFIASMTKMCLEISPHKEVSKGLNFINAKLSDYLPDGRFITAVSCLIDPENKSITYSNAGHPPPLLFSAGSKKVSELAKRGMPLSIDSDFVYQDVIEMIESGDKLLIYSDGLYETVNMNNEVMGLTLLAEKFLEFSLLYDIEETISKILDFQSEFSGGRMFRDDITIVGFEVL